jgi:putative transposase
LIRDRDRKFPDRFDKFWKESGVRAIKIPPRAPRANAFCESFIGTIKKSCLNHFVCFSLGQLDYINRTWLEHYHHFRPHQGRGIENNILDTDFPPNTDGTIKHREKLGGIISGYYREAA